MAEIKDLSITDANNNGTAANAGFPEGMPYSDVNNSARALEGMIARWYADTNGTLTTAGSASAYTLTPNRTLSAYTDGDVFIFEANHTNTGATTLNVSALGAKTVVTPDGAALAAGDITSGGRYIVVYDGTNFQLIGKDSGTARTAAANTFTATQTIVSTDAGSSAGPELVLNRDSASPLADDFIGRISWYGDDSGGNSTIYGSYFMQIVDPTDGSEDSRFAWRTVVAGTEATRFFLGHGFYASAASGGDKGGGTINAVAVYDDNTLLTDYVFDAVAEGSIDVSKWDGKVPNRAEPGRPVEVRTHEPARRFSARLDDLDPKAYGQKWKQSRRLPAFDHKAGEQLSVGEYAQRLLETCEVQAIHIDKLLERIEALEARNGRPN